MSYMNLNRLLKLEKRDVQESQKRRSSRGAWNMHITLFCICVYMYSRMYIYIYICTCACIYTYIYVYKYVYGAYWRRDVLVMRREGL